MVPDSNVTCELLPQAKHALSFFLLFWHANNSQRSHSTRASTAVKYAALLAGTIGKAKRCPHQEYVVVICCHQAAQILKSFSKVLAEHQLSQPLGKLGKRDGLEPPHRISAAKRKKNRTTKSKLQSINHLQPLSQSHTCEVCSTARSSGGTSSQESVLFIFQWLIENDNLHGTWEATRSAPKAAACVQSWRTSTCCKHPEQCWVIECIPTENYPVHHSLYYLTPSRKILL